MLQLALGAILGYILGAFLKVSIYSKKSGLGFFGAFTFSAISFIFFVISLAIYAEVELGATRQPIWVGQTSLFISCGLFYGIKRRKKLEADIERDVSE